MKKIVSLCSVIALVLCCVLMAGCQPTPEIDGIWADATYTAPTTLGDGATTFTVVVSAAEKEVTFTIKTDKETVGAALAEVGIIEDADGDGMFTVANGMTADYNIDQTYWGFYIDGEYAMTGVEKTEIEDGKVYSFKVSK